jgi:two-component system phosphate regulon sensor histidine kinase PhoR
VRSLRRTLLLRYAAVVGIMVVMVIAILLFGIQAGAAETIVFLVGLAILAALLGGITYWTQKTLADDLKEIGQGLEKIVLENDLDRMPQPRLAELSGLAQDMDTIAASVRENYRLLTQERDRLQAVLENISVGIIVVGKDLKTRMINPVAEKILGTSEEYALGRTFTEIHHTSSIDMAIEKARLGAGVAEEVRITLPRKRTLKVQANPIRTREGTIAGVICILEDITSRRRLERIRRDFVANVSHELRTPVANMRAVVDALMAGALEEQEAAARFMRDLDSESRRLADIIEDLLVLSRLESARREAGADSFPVVEVLSEIIAEKAELAQSNAVELTLGAEADGLTVSGNRKLIKTACSNLVDNAIKYNKPGGSVVLSVEPREDAIAITVSDTGIGIPSSEQRKIFERFYRVDKARSRETGGTGLGLSIVKHAAEFHGGKILVESTIGEGSTFSLELPATPTLF